MSSSVGPTGSSEAARLHCLQVRISAIGCINEIGYLVERANLVRSECTYYSVKNAAIVEEDKVILFPAEGTTL
jgi:hypothetical protein